MSDVVTTLRGRSLRARETDVPDCPLNTLDQLPPGAKARVIDLGDDSSPLARRLSDLGFSPGTEVEVVRRAPLRDPVTYRVRGCEICLRSTAACLIRVESLN